MNTELEGAGAQYAQAILELATKSGAPAGLESTVEADLTGINQVVAKTPDLKLILEHPAVSAEKKKALIVSAFKSSVDDLTMRLLELLADKRRMDLLPAIEKKYKALLNARKNIVAASLTCSEKLQDSAIANIKARLTEHLGKRLELDVKVDPSLIAGVVLRLGDQVIDGSVKTKLRELEKVLLSV